MSINSLAKQTVQAIGWEKDNRRIPEEHLTDIVECALNMPCAPLTATEQTNIKPYELWIPHRESELENALSCASLWAMDQCQDQTFNNASTVLVYVLKEPKHLAGKDLSKKYFEVPDTYSIFGNDKMMDFQISKDWANTKKLIIKKLMEEATKRKSLAYKTGPMHLNPFFMWNAEHVTSVNLTIGLAMGAVSLRCRELGYFCQNYTAYRQTVPWHLQYKNKFHSRGKWFPYMMQVIGTSPEAVKISKTREFRQVKNHTQTLFDPNHIDVDQTVKVDNTELQRIDVTKYKNEYRNKKLVHIPDYQIDFFMKHYGRYSADPKKLFELAYAHRVKKWESFFDEWIKKNNK